MPSTAFEQLTDFILTRMRMSHIYQPAMLRKLLGSEGKDSTHDIARSILGLGVTQLSSSGVKGTRCPKTYGVVPAQPSENTAQFWRHSVAHNHCFRSRDSIV